MPSPPAWGQVAGKPAYEDEDILFLFFTPSDASRAAGRVSLARMSRPGWPGSAVKTTDGAFPVIDSVVLARELPRSQLAIYPDAGHGFLFQCPERFAADVLDFIRR